MNADLATGDKRPHPLVGTVVEPYAILDVIAAGGMGVVFKARHMLTDRIVAMKLLPSELARDESNVQRVKLEAKALAQLNHPNIVTTFDFGFTYMQEPFIVMEYVSGQSLKEVLDREVLLPVDRAIKIFLQAVDGMRYAHSAKILHRDLKPHNIMVSEEPEPDHVKILDFGVAKFAEYHYAMAARLLGASHGRILFRHLVPGFASHIIVVLTMSVPAMILGETSLSFLGLGLRPPIVSWGVMLQDCLSIQTVANYPWLLTPVVFVVATVLAFNFLGDGLRDAADPLDRR